MHKSSPARDGLFSVLVFLPLLLSVCWLYYYDCCRRRWVGERRRRTLYNENFNQVTALRPYINLLSVRLFSRRCRDSVTSCRWRRNFLVNWLKIAQRSDLLGGGGQNVLTLWNDCFGVSEAFCQMLREICQSFPFFRFFRFIHRKPTAFNLCPSASLSVFFFPVLT